MDANELGRWTRFAAKGGIGKCVAMQDCIAEEDEDLMFLKDDEIVVLMQLPTGDDLYLGYCEGVVGRFHASTVRFLSRLKRPVMTKRSSRSLSRSSSRPSSSQGRESLSALTHRDSPFLPQAPIRTSQTFSSATVLVTNTTVSTTPHTVASLSPSPRPPDDHLRHVSHSSTSTAIESTPQTPADFHSEQSADQAISIFDSPTAETLILQEPKVPPEADDNAPLYADDPPDDDLSYLDSEPSARISPALSDDTPAIGLNLLQEFVNGNIDDGASVRSLSESVSTVDEPRASTSAPRPPVGSPRSSVYSLGSAQRDSLVTRDAPSRTSTHPSNVSSDYGGEEWDGASDIYDNYRYSRASMASKMSRFSKGSMHTVASGLGLDAPPLPISDNHRPSLDSVKYGPGSMRDRLGSTTTASSSVEDVRRTTQKAELPIKDKASPVDLGVPVRRVPSPLDLTSSAHTHPYSSSDMQTLPSVSPLLHSAFHSPLSSPGAQSPTHLSPTSAPSTAPLVPGGAASTLRQQLEMGKVPGSLGINDSSFVLSEANIRGKARLSSQPIVIDDDEGPSDTVSEVTSQTSPSFTLFSAAEEKKRMIETTYVVTNQAPPPPYTLTSPTEEAFADSSPNVGNLTQGARARSPRTASAFIRRSLFLPHPHAPKPAGTPHGPMYGREPVELAQSPSGTPLSGSATHTLQMALSVRGDPSRPQLVSIFARFERELTTSVHPVPVTFSLEPQDNVPSHHAKLSMSTVNCEPITKAMPQSPTQPIPRPNFFPQTPRTRPRSRSFSELDTSPSERYVTDESTSEAAQQTAPLSVGRSKSTGATPSPGPSNAKQQHKPSPLSIPSNNIVAIPNTVRPPANPLSQHLLPPSQTQPPPSHSDPALVVSMEQSSMSLTSPHDEFPTLPEELAKSPVQSYGSLGTSPVSPTSPLKSFPVRSVLRHSRSSTLSSRHSAGRDRPPSRSSLQGRKSGETDAPQQNDTTSVPYTTSLRSKLSLPALKIKGGERHIQTEERSPTLSVTPSESPAEQPRVHVKDVDFELVNPSVQQLMLTDEDPSISPLPSPARLDARSSLRSSSPVLSVLSGVSSPLHSNSRAIVPQQPSSPPAKSLELQDVEAHRQRELRWITAMASIAPSQARKSKKIRKLLYEGVPASVRYMVWAHVADSKAKRMETLYTKLIMRDRVPASTNIERDVQKVFAEESQLLDGSLMNLLQAYLTMVPDTQYSRGLTVIAGRLLLQAPEEDAFWTFVSMMDCQLRPYFSSNKSQLEVDAALFGKAVEAIEPGLAKKIFTDMDIPSISLCRPWFTAVFLEALPFDHSQRVWDIFLFEGVTFLFRVGLAIVQCCRASVMQISDRDSILHTLLHPPATMLPSSSDAFLEIASTVKFKDDEVRKQRSKLEAQQSKKLTQARHPLAARGGTPSITRPSISSISLPRNNTLAGNRHDV